jgi:hypothetical protein
MNKRVLEKLAKLSLQSLKVRTDLGEFAKQQLKEIQELKKYDEVFEHLKMLKNYCYAAPDKSLEIIRYVLGGLEEKPAEVQNIKNLGEIKGVSYEELNIGAIEILDRLKYIVIDTVIKELFEVVYSQKDEKIIKKATGVLRNMAQYELNVIRDIGFTPQREILEYIEGNDYKIDTETLNINLLEKLLSTELEGISWKDESTMTFERGELPPSKKLEDIRNRSLSYLMTLYEKADKISVKQNILKAMNNATCIPLLPTKPSSELRKLVVSDTNTIISYYTKILDEADLSIVRKIDRQAINFERKYGKELENLDELKTKIAEKEDYGVFKIFSNVEILDKEGKYLGWNEREKIYKEKVLKFVEELDEKTLPDWTEKLRKVLKSFEEDKELLSAEYLGMFLEEIGEKKPELAEIILGELEEELESYLRYILAGLWKSTKHQEMRERILKWANEGKHLRQIVFTLEKVKQLDYEILLKVFQRTEKDQGIEIYNLIIIALLNLYSKELDDSEKNKAKELMIKCVEKLTSLEDTYWTKHAYKDHELLNDLEEKDYEKVIDNLVYSISLDYHVEDILIPIISDYPQLITRLFKKRLVKENENFSKENRKYYDAIPLAFDHLTDEIKENEGVILPEILSWLDEESISNFQISFLLRAIWNLEDIVEYITEDKKFVLSNESIHNIISGYQGRISLDGEFVKIYLKNYKNEDDRESLMSFMSVPGGVVEGEYGFAADLESKLKYAESVSKATKSVQLKKFIEEYKEFLRRRAEYERRTSEEDVAIRKSRFNQ